jgi:prepilin-type N-terminal cleavage/methylation domain-containing protein
MKNLRLPIYDCRMPLASGAARTCPIVNRKSKIINAFTLIELLVVISILGILAALAVPALKNLGKSNVQVSAGRQLLDDIGHARQMAISQHTTVYMVFVPAYFWNPVLRDSIGNPTTAWNNLSLVQQQAATNLLDKQLAGYNFITLRSVGDQPGRGTTNYLGEWKALPDSAFIATNKFNLSYLSPYYYSINDAASGASYPIHSFNTNNFPLPTATNAPVVSLPYLAFNYLGQLTVLTANGEVPESNPEYIPLAQGYVTYAADINKALQFAAPDATENPPGNSTNSMFNVIRIDALTGRAVQLQQKIQ